ncbi:aldehyde dehydrogenase family protein [Virgibacillus necropolis]|uniref:aldehyde dehydrogenase family protein n=1 Tax=Virgibacillus necropolis TaxID=163877 RepID=UPI00384BCFE0
MVNNNLRMYINGEWVLSHNKDVISVYNPADKEQIATIPRGDYEDIDVAVKAAKRAFKSQEWQETNPHERGYILHSMAQKIRENKDEFAELETTDVGKPLSQGYADVEAAARYFEFYAGVADKIMGETIPVDHGVLDFTVREPIGVTAHIIPWNYPLQISARSAAAAIATGNTVVIKCAEDTPLTALKLAECFDESSLPSGVFNVVTGYGYEAGAALASHPDINHVTFTGSVQTGKAVMKAAAENVVPVTLELGGKSPNIVFSDCNMDEALQGVVKSNIQNAGQTCSAGSRLIVEESIKDTFIEKLKTKFENISIGPGLKDFDLGPILSEKQFSGIQSSIRQAEEDGCLIWGGKQVQINGHENGYYMQPTLITNCDPKSKIAQEEIFGPVLTVFSFKTEAEAVELANGTEYGLVTGIWTSNIGKANRVWNKVDSGQVFINNYGAGGGIQMPFGGYKKSGFGREKGLEALKNYTQVKNVAVKFE